MAKRILKIQVEGESKDEFGLWTLNVRINEKLYTYILSSEYIVRMIHKAIKKGKYATAISLLNKFKEINYDYAPNESSDRTINISANNETGLSSIRKS